MRSFARRTLLPAAAAAAVLTLSACGGDDDPAAAALPPAGAVPSAVAEQVQSDVGQFLVQPRQGIDKTQVEGTIARISKMPGVQSAQLNKEGYVDVVFLPAATAAQRQAVVKQMSALGEVIEGI